MILDHIGWIWMMILMIILMILDDGSRFTVFQATDATLFEHGNFRLFQAGECDVACQGSQGMQETLSIKKHWNAAGAASLMDAVVQAMEAVPVLTARVVQRVPPTGYIKKIKRRHANSVSSQRTCPHSKWHHCPSWSKCSHKQARMTWLEAADVTCTILHPTGGTITAPHTRSNCHHLEIWWHIWHSHSLPMGRTPRWVPPRTGCGYGADPNVVGHRHYMALHGTILVPRFHVPSLYPTWSLHGFHCFAWQTSKFDIHMSVNVIKCHANFVSSFWDLPG